MRRTYGTCSASMSITFQSLRPPRVRPGASGGTIVGIALSVGQLAIVLRSSILIL
jgi:hypothetical protein